MRIVVTGNIGAGKSTVIQMLMPLLPRFKLFDFDQAVADLYKDHHFVASLIRTFHTGDKNEISDIVHAKPEAMKQLEMLSNGALINQVITAINCDPHLVLDIPLFLEYKDAWGFTPDVIVVVDTPKEIRFNRVRERNGWSDQKIEAVMAKQLSDEDKRLAADIVIYNDCSMDALQMQVRMMVDHWLFGY